MIPTGNVYLVQTITEIYWSCFLLSHTTDDGDDSDDDEQCNLFYF